MSAVYRASDQPAGSREEYWRQVINETLVRMDLRFDGPLGDEQILTGRVGAVRVAHWTNGPGWADRKTRHIDASDDDLCKVLVHSEGKVVGEQHGRQNLLGRGDLTLVDLSQPFRCLHGTSRTTCVAFPRSLTSLSRDDVARLAGIRIRGDRGSGALISTLVRQLPEYLHDDRGTAGARLGSVVLDLFSSAAAEALDKATVVEPDTRRRVLLTQVHAFVEARLGDPSLSPATVAAAHHISLRYLHKLFEAEGSTVAGWIRTRRLERCRTVLLDPDSAGRPVAAVAAAHGFTSASHFSRVFRDRYGMPPAEFRTAYAGTPSSASATAPLNWALYSRA